MGPARGLLTRRLVRRGMTQLPWSTNTTGNRDMLKLYVFVLAPLMFTAAVSGSSLMQPPNRNDSNGSGAERQLQVTGSLEQLLVAGTMVTLGAAGLLGSLVTAQNNPEPPAPQITTGNDMDNSMQSMPFCRPSAEESPTSTSNTEGQCTASTAFSSHGCPDGELCAGSGTVYFCHRRVPVWELGCTFSINCLLGDNCYTPLYFLCP